MDLCLTGYPRTAPEMSKFFFWHLDKAPSVEGRFIHPLYHFHAGGRKMEGNIDIDGNDFVISSPRLAHPPMDVTLAIHFILQNFLIGSVEEGKRKNRSSEEKQMKTELMNDDGYKTIVNRARSRVLDPYFVALSNESSHEDYSRTNLFPLYL